MKRFLLALFALIPMLVSAESVTLAEWTFDTGYDVSDNVYTPNTNEWAQVGWNGFSTLPKILPNSCVGTAADYQVSAKGTRFWGIMTNNTEKILSLYQDMDPNNITDYTDATQHNQYFEITFPTTGYKNVQLSFAFTCGDNTARSMEMVVSTDGGATWADAGAYEGAEHWWVYNTSTVPMSANNKEKVIVRLIAPNGVTAQWRMNTIKITAEEAEAAQVVNETGFTASWSLKENEIVTAATTSTENLFSIAQLSWGEKLTRPGLRSDGTVVRQMFQPTEKVSTDDEGAAIVFTLKPKKSLTFTPKSLSFKASKVGTNGGSFDVVVVSGTESNTVGSNINPQLAKDDPYVSEHNFDLSSIAATTDAFLVKIYIKDLANNKQYAFSDVVITGDVAGTIDAVASYNLTTGVSIAGAGSVSCNPAGGVYDEGTEVKVSVKRNLGYLFQEWQNADGQTVSTSEVTTVTMDADKTLTAVFAETPVYTITTKVDNDADISIGSITLSPNNNNNKYEEGDEVVATANTSKILKFMNWEDETTTNPRAITVKDDMTITANYEVQDFIAVFDASKVQAYTYDDKPFTADLTWDENRNANCCVVKVSDNSLLYSHTSGTPVVRSREGAVMSGINGLYQNGYNTTEIAWQYQFSTKGFASAKFEADMAAKNAASQNWKAMISTDGTEWSALGEQWTMTANVKKELSFDLPAEAMGKDLVYVRIMGTGEAKLSDSYTFDKGTFLGLNYTDHSESGVGNVYVLGTAEVTPDTDAPQVTATIPADNATGVSASGKITISFDERIQAGPVNGVATLNGTPLTAAWNTRSVTFDYAGLNYGQSYTFSMPAGFVEDRSGNSAVAVEINFTVMDRQKPAARTFNAIVDASLELSHGEKIAATEDMPAQYRYLQDAINDAPSTNLKPYLIYVKEGYYADPNPYFNSGYGFVYADQTAGSTSTETIKIQGNGKSEDGTITYDDCKVVSVNKPNIHIIGQAVDKVTIATDRQDGGDTKNRSQAWYHVNAGAALEIQNGANDFYMENITIDNENWTKQKKAGPQALCINADADRVAWNNMNIRSYQDDFYSHGVYNRYFWINSRFEGSVDYIYGNGDIWFENTIQDINRSNGGYIVAPNHEKETRWGYVFNNTKIISSLYGDDCQVWLGRPWHNYPKTVFLNTEMDIKPYGLYWAETMGGLPALWAVYNITDKNGIKMTEESRLTYYSEETGLEYDYSAVVSGKTRYYKKAKNSLTADEAAQYTLANVMAGDGTSDPETGIWNPLPLVEKTATPDVTVNGNVATWTADEYAICYVVTVNGKPVAFPTEASYTGTEGEKVSVQSVNEYGALSDMSAEVTLAAATAINAVQGSNNAQGTNSGIYTIDGKKAADKAPRAIYIENGTKVAY